MTELLLENEVPVRIAFFIGVLLVMALWETLSPRRRREIPRLLRWTNNLGLIALDAILVRVAMPILPMAAAALGERNGWGLLNAFELSLAMRLVISIVVLDLVVYLQHVMFHAVPALWRVHRMHHADLEFDVTTGLRFHPAEILLSTGIKLAAVAALGPPPIAVLVFEVLLNATSMWNHSNLRLPARIDRMFRLLVVTPDMHRVHHSVLPREANSNFGFNLPWWDRLLGTYRAQPENGHEGMSIGIRQFRSRRELWLDRMLTQPFRGAPDRYPIGKDLDSE